jgi:hypothetical protein
MTKKHEVKLDKYLKRPRKLQLSMESELVGNGKLRPILDAVLSDSRLRLDIRDSRFNVYYQGGNLMLVDGRKRDWALHFDEKYFKGNSVILPPLPKVLTSQDDSDSITWVEAFPLLIKGMETWWTRHPKGERTYCQAIAAMNTEVSGLPKSDYLVLDLEYQWAQRRLDMIAAKRNPTAADPEGWSEPIFVFVEVKSELNACFKKSGLCDHATDYKDIIGAKDGHSTQDIKDEFRDVITQKKRLGLLDKSLPFKNFSAKPPELLLIFVKLDVNNPKLKPIMAELRAVDRTLGDSGHIFLMNMNPPDYLMNSNSAELLRELV